MLLVVEAVCETETPCSWLTEVNCVASRVVLHISRCVHVRSAPVLRIESSG
jgi:hypothetical protein